MVDYGKWKNIEVSDDEDDTHPNIDTPSLFRWRHQARVERMAEQDQLKKDFETKKSTQAAKKLEIEQKKAKGEDVTQLQADWDKFQKEITDKEEELAKKERLTPWNVDTIGQEGFSKTVINTKKPAETKVLSEEERAQKLQEFTRANESLMKQFGLLKKYADSRKFLLEHTHLACEETTNYLTIWCVNLALEEKIELMNHVSHQCIAMQFMLELAKQLDRDPRSCISDFFSKIAHVEQSEYKRAFDEELSAFRDRVTRRADEKIHEAMEEERKKRLGPGGLDPYEVFETLPDELKACFESQNVGLLQETITKMPEQEAAYHMKRCIDSGLWVPEANKGKPKEGSEDEASPEAPAAAAAAAEDDGTKNLEDETKAVSLEDK